MLSNPFKKHTVDAGFSNLYSQDTFYKKYESDLLQAQYKVIIESPFITARRMAYIFPYIQKLRQRGVVVIVNTKPIHEHEDRLAYEAESAVHQLQDIGVSVLYTVGNYQSLTMQYYGKVVLTFYLSTIAVK
jgi:hypothetical protein